MTKLLEGSDSTLSVLREQWTRSTVANRRLSGTGFFTHFDLPRDVPTVGNDHFVIDDVEAQIANLQHGATFSLFVRNGRIKMLEGAAYEEPWPPIIGEFALKYSTGQERDLSELRRVWTS
jgi:hypothetical protein